MSAHDPLPSDKPPSDRPVPRNVGTDWPIPKAELRDRATALLTLVRPLLPADDGVVELRALNVPSDDGKWRNTWSGYFTDHRLMLAWALHLAGRGATGVYATAHQLHPAVLARRVNKADRCDREYPATKAADVVRRRFLYLDVDPVRPTGVSATNAEKAAAHRTIRRVLAFLDRQGWPLPLLADSPNGYHAFYRVDLPADDGDLTRRVLTALATRFSDAAATIDTKVIGAAQLLRVPGTPGRKGDATADRPHRTGGVLTAPEFLQPVPDALLHALAAEPTAAQRSVPPATPRSGRSGSGRLDVPRWLADRGVTFSRGNDRPDGRVVYRLDHCPFNPSHRSPDACVMQATDGALSAHCFHASCAGRGWREFKAAIGPPEPHHYEPTDSTPRTPLPSGTPEVQDEPSGKTTPVRPCLVVDTEEHKTTAAAAAALAAEPDVFRRGSVLVLSVPREDGSLGVVPMPKPVIRDRLTRIAPFHRWEGDGADARLKPCHPPKWCIDNLFERTVDYRGIRPLQAIVNHPLVLADGTVLTAPGYHPASGTLLLTDPVADGPVTPTQDDAHDAAHTLLELVTDFPFATPADRAGWLAAALTPFAHAAYAGPAPLFWIDKTTPGVGGTLLVHLIAVLATGREAPLTTYTPDLAETRKLLTALSLAAPELLFFDNVEGRFGNAALAQFLTGTARSDRILGTSTVADTPCRPVSFASSNNAQLAADMTRRVLPIRLATTLERPERREGFRHPKLLAHVRHARPALIAAALTILRAWHNAGRPTQPLPPLGGFEDWSDVVRQAVVFAGLPDPADPRGGPAPEPRVAAMTELLSAWPELDPDGRGLTAAKVADRIDQARRDVAKQPDWMDRLIEAAEELCRGPVTASRLGYALREFRDRNLGGRFVSECGSHAGVKRWVVRPVAAARPPVPPAAGDLAASCPA